MASFMFDQVGRRDFLRTALATIGCLALPGGAAAQADNPVQRLLILASQKAFAKLMLPGGFLNSWLARFGMPTLFKKTPANASGPLGNDKFLAELQYRLNILAETGARGAAPAVTEAARKLVVLDPVGILRGRPFAATSALRLEMGIGLVDAMVPAMEQALVAAPDPIISEAVTALGGVALHDVANAVALSANNGIWYEIGKAEAEIRANPAMANDPALAAALRAPLPATSVTPN